MTTAKASADLELFQQQIALLRQETRDLYALASTSEQAQVVARVLRPDFGIIGFSRQNLAADELLGGSLVGKVDADWIPEPDLADHRQGVISYLATTPGERVSEYLSTWRRREVYRPDSQETMALDVKISVWVPDADQNRLRFVALLRSPADG